MSEIKPITTLNINGKEYEAKATFFFDKVAKKFSTEETDENGKKVKSPGFNVIYGGILERETDSIADFWECATAHEKAKPSREDIETAIMEEIEKSNDTINLLQGALQVMNDSGFFKQKSRLYWSQMQKAPKLAKEDDKETTKAGIEFMKENYKEIMGAYPY
ncbi:tail assembly chaperone [Mammaliicoccus sciuri]|uniref:tail assembly chaperone n=1 Tax=Mammaliicoccus sciuri TaxID=1296 RepID=UPI002B25B998|nr:tail assembly chaperone [Mammaliicoccus sciuri]MEB8104343.1 tail assembly chaperone [Mammaliicoccus sciuri]WQJ70505.1 tail assembly chaperone [Mammaliicoccus sciuri]